MTDNNIRILERIKGIPATKGDENDPANPNARPLTVAELAEMAFDAQERVRALEMCNTPTDYDERKKAFIKLSEARADAARAKRDLERATT